MVKSLNVLCLEVYYSNTLYDMTNFLFIDIDYYSHLLQYYFLYNNDMIQLFDVNDELSTIVKTVDNRCDMLHLG